MPVEIEPVPDSIQLSIPASGIRLKLRPITPGLIPQGHDAKVIIDGIKYEIHDYRKRPGHTPGARIESDGDVIELSPESKINALNKIIFRWKPSTPK